MERLWRPLWGLNEAAKSGELIWGLTTEYLLNEQLDRVLAALMPENELVCRTILQTGLRIGDVLRLRTEALGLHMLVIESKTGKRKRIYLTHDLLARLRANAGRIYVFEGRGGPRTHKTRQAVYADIRRAAKAFRLPQVVGTHSLRKIYAVDLMEKYGDIEKVRRALNHRYKSTTMIYAMADKLLQAKQGRRRHRHAAH